MTSIISNENSHLFQERPQNQCQHNAQTSSSPHDQPIQSCIPVDDDFRATASVVSDCSEIELKVGQVEFGTEIAPLDYRVDWSEDLDQEMKMIILGNNIISFDSTDNDDCDRSVSADWDMESVFSVENEEMEEIISPSFNESIRSYEWNTTADTIIDDKAK